MQVDFEKAITRLTERWEELTEGEKPIFVEITAYWPRDQYVAYISCHALEKQQSMMFSSFTEAVKWLVSEITAMIESEFYEQKNAYKHGGEKTWKN